MDEYYLAHHGIKGMRWGVRRYQNSDGTLTDAGRKRMLKRAQKYDEKAKAGGRRSEAHKAKAAEARKAVRTSDLTKARQAKEAKKQHEIDKENALKNGSATEVMKYRKELTNQEMQTALNRLNLERQISDLSAREIAAGKVKAETVVD